MSSETPAARKTIGLKIISVILAVLLWFYVVNHGELTASQDVVKVALQYRNISEGLSVKGPEQVSVKLWGALRDSQDVIAYVDLGGYGPGQHVLPVKVEPVQGVMFTSVSPDKLTLLISELKEESFPVKPKISRSPQPGFELLDIITVPDKCLLQGEETAVKRAVEVTAAVDLGEVKDFTAVKVPLMAKDAGGKELGTGIRIVPEKVLVYAVVGEIQSSKKIKLKTSFSGTPEAGYQLGEIESSVDELTVLGNKAQLEGLEEVSIRAIDLNGKKESFSQEIEIALPPGLKAYPARVLVHVEIKKDNEKEVVE